MLTLGQLNVDTINFVVHWATQFHNSEQCMFDY